MQSSNEAVVERSKTASSDLIASAPGSIDITSGTHSELLHSSAISISMKTAVSPSPVDCELEEADNSNAGLEQALKSFVRCAIIVDLLTLLFIMAARFENLQRSGRGRVQLPLF